MTVAYYERICQEDIEAGNGLTSKRNPGGGTLTATQVGLHTFAIGQAETVQAWTPGAVANGAVVSTTVAIPGAEVGDMVLAHYDATSTYSLIFSAHVQESGIVRVILGNLTGSSVTVPAGNIHVLVFKHR